jgi:NAD(P)-dependent dehydrogenase (short-subunit alcohol dehydrogenase family)
MAAARPFDLAGTAALVTGGNSGIGLGMAEGLAAAGAAVCIWGTSEEKNARAAERLRKHGGRVLTLRCDVADEAAVEGSRERWRLSGGSTPASSTPAWPGGPASPRSWR